LATILYFDAHYALADTLNLLLQHREGRIHSSNPIPREVANVVNSITEDLWQSGLLNNLLSFLAKFNVDDQLKRLESSRVIGSRQHRRDVLRLL
uniref:Transposase n=1 Tax=Mesocestoides corti TaxID=53468 RepID=A0A5K3G7Z3_MESCO